MTFLPGSALTESTGAAESAGEENARRSAAAIATPEIRQGAVRIRQGAAGSFLLEASLEELFNGINGLRLVGAFGDLHRLNDDVASPFHGEK